MASIYNNRRRTNTNASGPLRAGIYVRVSSEEQAITKDGERKASPETQEAEVHAKLEELGYKVVKVYRDIEKYRSGGRMVDPSGTRSDRPGYLAMLKDIDAGVLDVIGCWRVDRLYRGINLAFIELQDRVESRKVKVESVKDNFDPVTAGFLAATARMELQAKHDRLTMGVSRRLRDGKVLNTKPPLGYRREDGRLVIDDAEAEVVRFIWRAYGESMPTREIVRQLVARGLRRREGSTEWTLAYLHKMLHRDYCHSGKFIIRWDEKDYEVPIPPIVTPEVAARVKARLDTYHAYPAGHFGAQALAAGLAYCAACGYRMMVVSSTSGGRRYPKKYTYYTCGRYLQRIARRDGCAKSIRTSRLDQDLWDKVWSFVSIPGKLEAALEKRIKQLEAEETDAEEACKKIRQRLAKLDEEEARVAVGYRKGILSDKSAKTQKGLIDQERADLERELAESELAIGTGAERLKELAAMYRAEVLEGKEAINGPAETPEEKQLQYVARHKFIERLVTRVDVQPDKSIKIQTVIDLGQKALSKDLCITTPLIQFFGPSGH